MVSDSGLHFTRIMTFSRFESSGTQADIWIMELLSNYKGNAEHEEELIFKGVGRFDIYIPNVRRVHIGSLILHTYYHVTTHLPERAIFTINCSPRRLLGSI